MTARECALKVLNRCFISGAWSSQTLDSELNRLRSGQTETASESDTAFATRLVLSVLQNQYLLDFYINSFMINPAKIDIPVRNILRIGACQLCLMDRIPAHAAVNESVDLCKKSGFRSASGLVNAVLRKISLAVQNGTLPEAPNISIKYSHPEWFVDRLVSLRGYDAAVAFLKADNSEAPVEIRPAFTAAQTYVQDSAAFEAVRMASPEPGMTVLDACSAPGGKSFTCAVLMNNCGKIISCDIHAKKLNLVRDNAERLGIDIITTMPADASVYNFSFDSSFDLVIADVPCSGFGVIRKKPEIRYKDEYEISGLPAVQMKIINNLGRYVRTGGTLLYSTCTIFPEENEDVVSAFLEDNRDYYLKASRTFYPDTDGTDGFYAAVLKRKQ